MAHLKQTELAPHVASFVFLILPLLACGGTGDLTSATTSSGISTGTTGTSSPQASTTEVTSTAVTTTTVAASEVTTTEVTATEVTATEVTATEVTATEVTTTTGESSGTGENSTTGGRDDLPPTEGVALEAWLALGSYKSWPAESKVHPSTGPHGGNVRTYVNAALFASLTAKNAIHPQGVATVKELYGGGVDMITGYAVMVKVAPDSANGQGWYWYERIGGTTYADGTGVGLCSGCHVGGTDYVLTPFPLQ